MKLHRFTTSIGACALLAAATTAATSTAGGLQVCYSDGINTQTTNWTSQLTVPKFDPAMGVLLSVDFELRGDILGSAAIESLDAQASTVTSNYQAAITLTRPDTSVIVVAVPVQQFIDSLTAFDGTVDFAGTSGITHANISTNAVELASSSSAADLALFTGPSGAPGTISLPVDAIGTSSASGSGNLITQFLTDAGASLVVCYNYGLDCNGNGIDDALDVSNGSSNDLNGDGIPDECQPDTRSFCEGDGSQNGGADCPCNNNGGPGEGCDNGSGSGGLLTASGVPSVSNDTLFITSSQIPALAPGFFFAGNGTINGGDGTPFDNGIRCIANPVRVKKINFGGTIPQGNMPVLSIFLGAQPGDTTYFQYWYRNPTGPCTGLSANTTNGVQVTWGL